MRKVITPVLPALSLIAVTAGILLVAEPLARLAVDALFSALGY